MATTTVTLISETRSSAFLLVSERNDLQHPFDVEAAEVLRPPAFVLMVVVQKSRSKDTDA